MELKKKQDYELVRVLGKLKQKRQKKDYINWGKILTKWEQTVHEISNKFGLVIEHRRQKTLGKYCNYYVIETGFNGLIVYNTKTRMYEQTEDIKFAEECVKAYIPIIKKWKVHFKEQALESDFK